ncbi:MAG: ABC transporter permease subunit [Myxococcales bacterium]|jgi:ABC-2 type transport system permease protein
MGRAAIVLRKELSEILSNRSLIASLSGLPITMVVVSLFVLATYVRGANDPSVAAIARWYVGDLGDTPISEAIVQVTLRNAIGLFLAMPVFLPVLIASQSVAGEKERRTLEPLLATPITARELVLGKSLATVVPATGITLVAFVVFAVGADLICWPLLGRLVLPDATFLFAVFVLAPLLSFLGNCISVLISARVSDVRLAQSLAGLVVMPFVGVVVLQFVGLLAFGPLAYALTALAALAADVVMLRVAVRFFDRDRLLTRWS